MNGFMKSLAYVALTGALTTTGAEALEFQPTGVTGAFGLASPEGGLGSTFHFGVRSDLGTFQDNLLLESGFHFWKKSYNTSAYDYSFEWSVRDLALTSGVKYLLSTFDNGVQPYARAGVGLHFASISLGNESYGTTDLGLYAAGGFLYPISPTTQVGLDLSYNITDVDHLLVGVQVTRVLGS